MSRTASFLSLCCVGDITAWTVENQSFVLMKTRSKFCSGKKPGTEYRLFVNGKDEITGEKLNDLLQRRENLVIDYVIVGVFLVLAFGSVLLGAYQLEQNTPISVVFIGVLLLFAIAYAWGKQEILFVCSLLAFFVVELTFYLKLFKARNDFAAVLLLFAVSSFWILLLKFWLHIKRTSVNMQNQISTLTV